MPSIYETVRAYAENTCPDKLALLSEEDGTRTYAELRERGGKIGWSLHHRLGLTGGSRLSVWLAQTPQWIETALGASAAGVSLVAANPQWTDSEYQFILNHSRTKVIVTDAEHADRALRLKESVSTLEQVVVVGNGEKGSVPFEALLDEAPATFLDGLPDVPATSEGSLNYTSGTTTGRPKAVEFKQVHMPAGVDYHTMWGLNANDRCITVSPFFHGNGLYGGVFGALGYGASVVFPRRFSARRFWGLVDTYRPTYMVTLAAIMNILFSLAPTAVERDNSFRVLVVLGSAANADELEERYGVPIIDWYGLTEGGAGVYTPLDRPKKKGSAGVLMPGSTMTIRREDGSAAGPNEVGEVAFPAESSSFGGYVDDPEATAAVLHDGYVWTGDLGYFDHDGYFFFMDRKKDIVRRGGENISSVEVETALLTHPAVAEAAVVGKRHPVLGEQIAAFVVPTEGFDVPSVDEMQTFLKGHVADFKAPEWMYPIEVLPRTGTKKVEKFRLREIANSDQQ
jgi:acyl-coenzyme A synthetase/AMP-(fatty) acid ligase